MVYGGWVSRQNVPGDRVNITCLIGPDREPADFRRQMDGFRGGSAE